MKAQQAKANLWRLQINTKLVGNEWDISMTASEHSILMILRAAYGTFEAQLKEIAKAPGDQRPAGLIDEALALLRCLVFGRLEPIQGKHIHLMQV